MLYNPPSKWTEKLLDELPFGEDDRYERKSGAQLVERRFDEFVNGLAKEIGAFANSFGGTLFLGIADDKTKIGVPSLVMIKKKEVPIERWLENKIPTLFEMRLQHFRISKLDEIDEETQQALGADRTLIAIDVFDSELAPHQCVFDQKYYYRSNSESRPAPHHYLAFLWGRSNPNMSNVARWWLRDFLNPLIEVLRASVATFEQNRFLLQSTPVQTHATGWNHRIELVNKATIAKLQARPVGEYFLSSFPTLAKEIDDLTCKIELSEAAFEQLISELESSSLFLEKLRELYIRRIQQNPKIVEEAEAWDLQETSRHLAGELHLQVSNHPAEAKMNFVHLTAYQLIGFELEFSNHVTPNEFVARDICEHVSDHLTENDSSLSSSRDECKNRLGDLSSATNELWIHLKNERIEIAKRYGATFEDV